MSGQPKILVIDDNEEILSILHLILERHAYATISKTRIDDIINTALDISPDLVLLDKNLGYTDGCDLCRRLKTNDDSSHIPVIMFSAYHKQKGPCLSAGADDFVEKPFRMKELLEKIDGLIDQPPAPQLC